MAHSATTKDLQAALSLLTLGDRALPANLAKPKVGIVCGSGLGGLVNILRNKVEFAYTDIPGFVNSTGKQFQLLLSSSEMEAVKEECHSTITTTTTTTIVTA